jgi:two-component system response regulator MprA
VRILVVDDEASVRASVVAALARVGYTVETANDGDQALKRLAAATYDAVVLDVRMPEIDGLEVCRRLRAQRDHTPVLMLTARDLVADRVSGLDTGADDYLVKPFAIEELRARIGAMVRRATSFAEPGPLRFADLVLDPAAMQTWRAGKPIELTRTEFALLELFLRNPRRVLTRTVIFERVWGYDFGPTSNALWVYVSYLRKKLEVDGAPRLIQTVRGVGYSLREAA